MGLLEEKKNDRKIIREEDGEGGIDVDVDVNVNVDGNAGENVHDGLEDWVAEFVRVLDEGVIVSGAPGREEVVEKVLGMLEGWLCQGVGVEGRRKRKRERERERERWVDGVGLQWQEEEEDGGDDDDVNVKKGKRKKRRVSGGGNRNGNGDYASDDYFYPPYINPLPLTFSTCDDTSSSVPSASVSIDYPIPRCDTPSLVAFEAHLRGVNGMIKTDQTGGGGFGINGHDGIDIPTPLVLTSAIAHWPAICDPSRSWDSPRYLLSRALGGRRLVPVEIGRSYVDEGWGQKIVPFGEFMGMLLDDNDDDDDDDDIGNGGSDGRRGEKGFDEKGSKIKLDSDMRDKKSKNSSSPDTREIYTTGTEQTTSQNTRKSRKKKKKGQKWYLAQHDLFTQMPALRADIAIPEYCYLSSTPTPPVTPSASPTSDSHEATPSSPSPIHLNAWLGPAGTISPLHTDPHHNILAQVVGQKYVRLYAPSDTEKVYPRGVDSSCNRKKMRRRTKEDDDMYAGENNQEREQDHSDDDDNDDNDEYTDSDDDIATTPHQSANTSHVDVGDVLPWAWEWEAGNNKNGDNSIEQSLYQEKQQQQQEALQNIRTNYPLFLDAPYLETVLEPGECLFIPRSWWHYVRSLSTSFSVSFWWD